MYAEQEVAPLQPDVAWMHCWSYGGRPNPVQDTKSQCVTYIDSFSLALWRHIRDVRSVELGRERKSKYASSVVDA